MKNYDFFRVDERIKDGKELRAIINTPLSEIENLINILKQEVNKSEAIFSVLKETCLELISRLPLPIHIYDNSFILRSRPNYNGEVFKNISDLSYNPYPSMVNLGRFNLKEESVFYGAVPISSDKANGALTTICESFKNLFDSNSKINYQYLTIGKWNVLKPINLVVLTFYDEAWKRSQHIQNINPLYTEFIGLSCNEEDNIKCQLFYKYFSECAGKIVDTDNNYLLTTAFYHALQDYYGSDIGILYSSSITDN